MGFNVTVANIERVYVSHRSDHLIDINFYPNWLQPLKLNNLTQIVTIFFHHNVEEFRRDLSLRDLFLMGFLLGLRISKQNVFEVCFLCFLWFWDKLLSVVCPYKLNNIRAL